MEIKIFATRYHMSTLEGKRLIRQKVYFLAKFQLRFCKILIVLPARLFITFVYYKMSSDIRSFSLPVIVMIYFPSIYSYKNLIMREIG